MLGQLDYQRHGRLRSAFSRSAQLIAFPPSAALPSEWRRELEALAQELGYRTAKAEEIEQEFAAVFQRIVTAAAPER
jgi:hypothetical protein